MTLDMLYLYMYAVLELGALLHVGMIYFSDGLLNCCCYCIFTCTVYVDVHVCLHLHAVHVQIMCRRVCNTIHDIVVIM